MKLDIFDVDEFVRQNKAPQVSNPIFFNSDRTPNTDGLFSYELFGMSDKERKNIFGYIDLKGRYIHPLIYSMMRTRMGSMRDLIAGTKYAKVIDGKIIFVPEDFDGAETGLDFIYKHFDKINWIDELEESEMDSIDKKTRLKFLKDIKKEEFFVSKWLVIPPYYRAENSEDITMGDEINKMYKELISRTNSMSGGFGIQLFGDSTRLRIQNLLLDLFTETTRPVKGKGSLLRKHLLGKTIDYTASNVMTAPEIAKANSPKDLPVNFGYSSFPIATVISLFNPFYVSAISDFLTTILNSTYQRYGEQIKSVNLNQFSTSRAEKMIKFYIKSESERFKPIEFEFVNQSGKTETGILSLYEYRSKKDLDENNFIKRDLTYTDLFFIITMEDVVHDKHIYITRYPVINFQNIVPVKIKLMTTSKTRKAFIKLVPDSNQFLEFDNYPYIKFDNDPKPGGSTDYNFINVLLAGNTYIGAMGGDYDGDMLYMKGLFTKEANAEAEQLIKAKSNFLGASGEPSRGIATIGKEAVMSLFELTKEGS